MGKRRGCGLVNLWLRSIVNHLYWCAGSSGGDGELCLQKWLSLVNHIQNVHEGHSSKYPKCNHGPLPNKEWFVPGK